jgi:sugar lactone lactonase YvrE
MELYMYSLADGSLVRKIGGAGSGKGQFNLFLGGLCVSPDGDSVLVAEYWNKRVQQVRIVDGSWVRFVGEGLLGEPEYVDCNADVIVVSEEGLHRISVLSWADGSVRAQFGSDGSGPG